MDKPLKVYCDTNIYLDYLLGRKDHIRPLDEFAYKIFRRVEQGAFLLIISDHLLHELEKHLEERTIQNFLDSFYEKQSIIDITKTTEDIKQAKQLSETNWKDMLHAILANKAHADYLVTRNIKDFAGSEHLIQTVFPEQI